MRNHRRAIEPLEAAEHSEWYEVEALSRTYLVSRSAALDIERELARAPQPGWLTFVDVFGDAHRILAWEVRRVSEVTPLRRQAWRVFSGR